MGWTSCYREPGESHRDFFQREVLSSEPRRTIIDSHFDRSTGTFYAAVEEPYSTRQDPEVWALVILTGGRSGSTRSPFMWKEMDETQGPAQDDCPIRILRRLSPTEQPNALAWRRRCRERAMKRAARESQLTPGAILEFATAYILPSGPCRRFELLDAQKGRFRALTDGTICGLASWRRESYTLDTAQAVEAV